MHKALLATLAMLGGMSPLAAQSTIPRQEPLAAVWQQLGLLSRGGRRGSVAAPTADTGPAGARR